jgi:hypothetical protein
MGFISTRTHGLIDYVFGFVLFFVPPLFGFADVQIALWLAIVVGTAIIAVALVTDYEPGVIKAIPMRVHLGLDVVEGIFLAASPWFFGFADRVWAPLVVLGAFEVAVALCTRTTPRTVNR